MNKKTVIIFSAFCVAYLLITQLLFGKSCPFTILFGCSCPGCGMSRAILCLVKFRIADAFHYHPLVFTVPILFIVTYRIISNVGTAFDKVIFTVLIFLFIVVYIFRILEHDPIIIFRFEDGLLAKLIS